MNDHKELIGQAIRHFNAGEFRSALLAFEQVWHDQRSSGLRAMIQLCNALHQLELGLVTAPRHNLSSAVRLLEHGQAACAGIEMAIVLEYIRAVQACIPDGLETGDGRVLWAAVPRIAL